VVLSVGLLVTSKPFGIDGHVASDRALVNRCSLESTGPGTVNDRADVDRKNTRGD